MALAMKCNSCGAFFEPEKVTGLFGRITGISVTNGKQFGNAKCVWQNDNTVHLCPDCMETLAKWLNIQHDILEAKEKLEKAKIPETKVSGESITGDLFKTESDKLLQKMRKIAEDIWRDSK